MARRKNSERAKEIRLEYAEGNITMATLAEKHGIVTGTVSKIVRGKHFPDGDGPIQPKSREGYDLLIAEKLVHIEKLKEIVEILTQLRDGKSSE